MPSSNASADRTLAFATQGYEFIGRLCDQRRSDVVQTRLVLRRTVVMRGAEAARLFYDDRLFRRHGAMPLRVRRTLLGQGGVQGLDGDQHRGRKAMFLDLLGPGATQEVVSLFLAHWRDRLPRWESAEQVVLMREMGEVLCAAVSEWAGLPVTGATLTRRTQDLEALIDSAGRVGPGYWRGVLARRRAERRLGRLVQGVRDQTAPTSSEVLERLAAHRDEPDGAPLPPRVAAVELLNLLRPVVAIERYITFAALALHENPAWRERLRGGTDHDRERFVQEVRRRYPFFPAVAAVTDAPVTLAGQDIPHRCRVVLDLYGTDRDPRTYPHPERFDPDRFEAMPGEFAFIPQGGGDPALGHRCPGEPLTVDVMKAAVGMLVDELDYEVPPQDLRVSTRRMPTGPASGFLITRVRSRGRDTRPQGGGTSPHDV